MDKEHTDEEHTMDIELSQETSLDNWGMRLMENILLTAAEAVSERREASESIEVTLTFRLTPIVAKYYFVKSVSHSSGTLRGNPYNTAILIRFADHSKLMVFRLAKQDGAK